MNSFVTKLVAAGAVAALSVGTAAAADMKWDLANEYQASSIFGQGDEFFANKLKELSGGKIELTLHLGGSLGYKSKDHFDAVGDGAIQMADSFTGSWQGFDPIFTMPSLPFLVGSVEEAYKLYQVAKPFYEEVFAKNNQKLLYASAWPPSGMWGKKPLDSIEAIKNLRIRSYDPNGTRTLKAAGAAPIQLSWADVVPQLSTGGIDAVLTSAEGGVNAKFWEHLNHFTEINYALPLSMVHMNKDTYDGLSADMKKAVDEAAAATEKNNWDGLANRRANNYKTMKSNGMTVVTGVSKDYLTYLSKAGEGALKDWLEKMGDRGEKIIAGYNKAMGK
jgi:TRAP-type C4-dicarboxylate transport system substrate-binding protein